MSDTYAIIGFSDSAAPVVLYESDSDGDCARWRDGYTRAGDWGGYDSLALYEIAPHQTAETIFQHDAPIDVTERETY
jgi:hypothetical protein